jgi:hypothetical protein
MDREVLHSQILPSAHAVIYVFYMDLKANNDYVLVQHQLTGFYNREKECLLRGVDLPLSQAALRP